MKRPEITKTKLSTDEAAYLLCVKPQSARASMCRVGNWLGMTPVKLPNGKLLWSAEEVERLICGLKIHG